MPNWTMQDLLRTVIEKKGSDLHLTTDSPPQIRIAGRLHPAGVEPLTGETVRELCLSVLTEKQALKLQKLKELDFSFEFTTGDRFRGSLFLQKGNLCGAFRFIPKEICSFEALGLPEVLSRLADSVPGLVLVTGATGSGKSTTLAAMVDLINTQRSGHIITIEDPMEFIHKNKKSIISQREVHTDTESFSDALRFALRQDPDVVLVGEMRDYETIAATLTVAETGHLTLATLHTNSAVQTINRIIDVFPSEQQFQVRTQLAFSLKGIVSQMLLPRKNGVGRVLALEILIPNTAIRTLIRENKLHQIESQMVSGQSGSGMQTMDQHLAALVVDNLISRDIALHASHNPTIVENEITRKMHCKPVGGGRRAGI